MDLAYRNRQETKKCICLNSTRFISCCQARWLSFLQNNIKESFPCQTRFSDYVVSFSSAVSVFSSPAGAYDVVPYCILKKQVRDLLVK